jgi:hypothetical protein
MFPLDGFDVIEVWNGLWTSDLPWNADNEAAVAEWGRSLAAGIHTGGWRPAMGNSDTHLRGQVAVPHTVVLAEELSAVRLLTDRGRVHQAELPGVVSWETTAEESAYVRVEVRHADGHMAALTNPIVLA